MPIATVNPATGETLKTFDALSAGRDRRRLATGRSRPSRRTAPRRFARRGRGCCIAAADLLDADQDDIARTMTTEMGKTLTPGPRRGREVRQGDALVRRPRRGAPRRRAPRRRRRQRLRRVPARSGALPPARPGARGHAVELPALAGRSASPRPR